MERKESKERERANIRLSFMDLFPSYEEIDENNDGIIISFPNIDLTYNLLELIKNQEEIFVPQQIPNQTIKITLMKSNSPYATGPFTVKNGEQWVTFTYGHKKKQSSNFALSLIDCIKIKFSCKLDIVPALNLPNNIVSKTEIQTTKKESLLTNIIENPTPKKLYNNLTTKKKNSHSNIGNNNEHDSLCTEESKFSKILENITPEIKSNNTNNNLNNTTLNSSKNTNNPLLRSENLSEFNALAVSSGVIAKDFKMNEKNKGKNAKKIHTNNNMNLNTNNSVNIENKKSSNDIGPLNQKKRGSNKYNELNKEKTTNKIGNNSLNNIANTIDTKNVNENIKSKQNLKRNKSKNLMDSNINNKTNKTSKKDKHTKSMTGNLNNLNNNKKITKDLSSKNLSKKKEEKNEQNEENTQNNNLNENKAEINPEIKQENIIENKNPTLIENKKDINQITEANKLENDNNENINIETNNEPLFNQDNDELDNYVLDNFTKKLEDFQLLYNDEYIKSIKKEDFSLEIELYIEKFIELITEYHIQTEEKDLEYQLLKNMYQKNIFQYLEINKLYKKLQLIKDNYDLKKNNPKPLNENHDKNYINNLITNKVEINMFKFLLFSHKEKEAKEKKEQIKKILKTLLGKAKLKNIINQNDKISKWIQKNMNVEKQNQGKDKGKKKGNKQKTQQNAKDFGTNKNDKKKKVIANSPSKSKNKLNKNGPDEKEKEKKNKK